jgi:hypothetical protein
MLRNREDCILRIGIIGNGELGKAIQQLQCSSIDIMVYDMNPDVCHPLDTSIEVIETCDLIFYCIPTEMNHHTSCDTTVLSEYISLLTNPYKIICSTVPIGYSQSMGCSIMILPSKEPWIVGMIESPIAEECKKRMIALRETCHKEGTVLDDTIQWSSATELETAIVYKTMLSEAWTEMAHEVDEFVTKKNMNSTFIKQLCTFLPDNLRDIHSAYHQIQIADTSFPILQHVIKRGREPITTDKKISLVIGTRNDKLIEDVCRNLIRKDNIVILFSDTPILLLDADGNIMKDVLSKTGSFRYKQFFPKLDYIWDFSKMDSYTPTTYTDKTVSFIETMNKLELVKTHNCSLSFLSDHDEDDELVSAFVNEYPEHQGKVEIIHILFDKNEMSDYILH